MSYSPVVNAFCNIQQGGVAFPYPAGWTDVIQVPNSGHVEYDIAAARTVMGLAAGQGLFIIFSADAPFWANFFANAAVPSGNTTNGTASEYAPNQRYIDATVTKISFAAPAAANVSLQFYRP